MPVKLVRRRAWHGGAGAGSQGARRRGLISGDNGGTGASAAELDQASGLPWELAWRRRSRCCLLNDLRSRIKVRPTAAANRARWVVARLLGAEEFGFATIAADRDGLHHDAQVPSDTCSVALPRRTPVLRARFQGSPSTSSTSLLPGRADAPVHGEAGLPHRR